ncbi:MAG: class I SAM-dependent methyltransferase [Actinomycetota bacterium]|nr:class I SAM-dependent methyltransferase [Actinomycetota bacterium]
MNKVRAALPGPATEAVPPWCQTFFAEDYLSVFGPFVEGHRARAEAACVQSLLGLGPGARVLDLACGQGRHTSPLRSAGLNMVGLDLSPVLLRAAAERDPQVVLLRADMRALPLVDACMDGVVNLFNAFGYFSSDEQDVGVLREVVRVLRPGSVFVQEVHHRDALVRGWEPRTVHPTYEDGLVVTEERRWDGVAGRHAVTYLLRQGEDGVVRRLKHELRVYSLTELVALHVRAGLEVISVRGGLETSSPGPDTPLCVLVSRRPLEGQTLPCAAT